MLQLTKRTEYGLIALVHMVDRGGEFVSAREVSDQYPIPKRLLAEVLKDLSKSGLVDSQRGAAGGYALARRPEDITVGDIVSALEGAPTLASCEVEDEADARGTCEVEPVCPIRSPLQRIRQGIWRQMQRTSLRALVDPLPSYADISLPVKATLLADDAAASSEPKR
ncbi:MAG: Rrf2 family transcriptional regulator [Planctomycetes bacterium]|nr:Rrf2 family transcriptional regulator [Planctomycetota bacterium]